MHTLVIGLGNPILTDDGVGVKVAQEVEMKLPSETRVDVRELSVGGLALMEQMIGYERVIIIDAIQTENFSPGSIQKITLDDLKQISPTQHSTCVHDTSLITALELAIQMDLPIPKEVTIFTVEAENVIDFGEQLTPAVARVVPVVVDAVLMELNLPD